MSTLPRKHLIIAKLLFGLGVLVRIWGAWAMRCITEPDPSVVGLMARHMAALQEFPIFFYGQAYMGSLEPLASAVMIRIFGSNGFALNLGPSILSVLVLLVLWMWARTAFSVPVANRLLALLIWGPISYFHYQLVPRGGYVIALLVQALVLFWATHLAAELRSALSVAHRRFFLLGLVAGLGLWSNFIVAPALLVAVLILAHGMRGRFLTHGRLILWGAVGSVVGLMPWIVYNLQHNWASLQMPQFTGYEPVGLALKNSCIRFLQLYGVSKRGPALALSYFLAVATLFYAVTGGCYFVAQWRELELRARYAVTAATMFIALFSFVYLRSGFTGVNTPRYWLPLVPTLMFLGSGASFSKNVVVRYIHWLGFIALFVGFAWTNTRSLIEKQQRAAECLRTQQALIESIQACGADCFVTPIHRYYLNFASAEKIAASDGKHVFYRPIMQKVELATNVVYAADYFGIQDLLRQRQATWRSLEVAGCRLLADVSMPRQRLNPIPVARIHKFRDTTGADQRKTLCDLNLDTWWSPPANIPARLEIEFDQPLRLAAIRLLFSHSMTSTKFNVPTRLRIEFRRNGSWTTLGDEVPVIPLEVSGSRVYYPGDVGTIEFPLENELVEGVAVAFTQTRTQPYGLQWRLAELMLFGRGTNYLDAPQSMDALVQVLTNHREAIVYAPRWISNELLRRGLFRREQLAGLNERAFPLEEQSPIRGGSVDGTKPAVFIVAAHDCRAAREVLLQWAMTIEESNCGEWHIFHVPAHTWRGIGLGLPPPVRLCGDLPLVGHTRRRAMVALKALLQPTLANDVRLELLDDLFKFCPSALAALPESVRARAAQSTSLSPLSSAGTMRPMYSGETLFANGIRLLGYDATPVDPQPGTPVTITLYWSYDLSFRRGREIVFVHLLSDDNRIIAQDDFRGTLEIWDTREVAVLPGEIATDVRTIFIPTNASGALSLAVGLYNPKTRFRIPIVRSAAPNVRRRAAIWPEAIQVQSTP